ncbi:cache domain-containing protein [Cohaesibacter gelatinilyticus]|uniref:histidine kinase n=1 Tax=Cohaesibacter gelatinilyticus TaxID=372072 RepID=A0A285PBM1_9HYPH|nr:cache domain-containing protein [Cohaesibacter gelatinilyticus]SNZ19132.1 HAMP domain-containing protein [Cohaesibacter gelatinilyticus]
MLLSRLTLFWKISIPAFILFFFMMALTALNLNELWHTMQEERVTGLKHIIQSAKTAVTVVQKQEKAGLFSRQEAQIRAKAALEQIRYDDGVGYVFVFHKDGTNLVHPNKALQGTNLLNVKDSRGNYITRDLITLSEQGGGRYTYLWEKPNGGTPIEKISWVEAIPEWQWVLGTGIYTDDLKAAFHVHAAKTIGLTIFAFAFAGFVSYLVIQSISKPMGELIRNMGQLAAGESNIAVEGLRRQDEVGRMARAIRIFIANENHRKTLEGQLQQTMNEVRFNRDLLINAVDVINDGIIIFDESDRLILANRLMLELYPSLSEHLEKKSTITELGIEELPSPGLTGKDEFEPSPSYSCEKELHNDKWYRIEKSRTLDGGSIAVFSNITEYKKQNVKLQGQTSELVKLLQKEMALAETQREFVTMASHEFKTPLTIINGNIRRIEKRVEDITPDRLLERTANIQNAVQRMQFLIERFMSFSSDEIEGVKIQAKSINLQHCLKQLCEGYCEAEEDAVIHCNVDNLPEEFLADEVLLNQCLSNIILNAVKYSAPRSPVRVEGQVDDKYVTITVQDQGVGIAEDELPSIFKKYFRASSGLSRAGTGIGLHFAKMVLDEHGGNIKVESTLGKGSCFNILLPASLIGAQDENTSNLTKQAS